MRPTLIAHADWGTNPNKQWLAQATLTANGYRAFAPEPVGEADTLVARLQKKAGAGGCLFLGFDFPIGLPLTYARQAGIDDFLTELPQFGQGRWVDFYRVAVSAEQISLGRPFYPMRPGGTRQRHLLEGLNLEKPDDLRRWCDLRRPNRRAAAPIFWTLGGQQVGKAAINGWRTVLAPAIRSKAVSFAIWPFSGQLMDLFRPGQVVAAETYPAECYDHLGVKFSPRRQGKRSGKRVRAERQANAGQLLRWADQAQVEIHPDLQTNIEAGFGFRSDGEDRFDAVVGLFGMINVVLGHRPPGTPLDEAVRCIEGWILGQEQHLGMIA